MEIISSRLSDVSDVEKGKRNEMLTTGGGTERILLTPLAKTVDIGNQEDIKKAITRTASLLPQPSVQGDIGASPVEIARAYMQSRISGHGPGLHSISPESETARLLSDEFASKPSIRSSAPWLSTCWPGAIAQQKHCYHNAKSKRQTRAA